MLDPGEIAALRHLWASVLTAALSDYRFEARQCGRDDRRLARHERSVRRYLASRDAAEVISNAGLTPSPAAIEALVRFALDPRPVGQRAEAAAEAAKERSVRG